MTLIHNARLPLGVVVGVTIEPLKEDEKIAGRLLLVKEYGVVILVSL